MTLWTQNLKITRIVFFFFTIHIQITQWTVSSRKIWLQSENGCLHDSAVGSGVVCLADNAWTVQYDFWLICLRACVVIISSLLSQENMSLSETCTWSLLWTSQLNVPDDSLRSVQAVLSWVGWAIVWVSPFCLTYPTNYLNVFLSWSPFVRKKECYD